MSWCLKCHDSSQGLKDENHISKTLESSRISLLLGNRLVQNGLSVWHETAFSVFVVPGGLSVLVPQMVTPVMMSLFKWKILVSFEVSTQREAT